MNEFCDGKGITHEVIAQYTPQQNGVVERGNKTLVEMTRCLLKGKKLPHSLWGEAVSTAAYLLNRCPIKALADCTLEEAWTGIKPSVSNLKIFGSVCFKHVPDVKRKKLANKSEVYILVGFHPIGSYRLYNPRKNEIEISKDVLVDKTATFNWVDAKTIGESVVSSLLEDKKPEKAKEVTQVTAGQEANNRRSRKTRFPSKGLADHEVFMDNEIDETGDLAHYALLADTKTLTWEQAIKMEEWKQEMKEELRAIEKNGTWEMMELPR